MRKSINVIAAAAWFFAATSLVAGFARAADAPAGPQVSKNVAKQLKAANDAVQAKNLDEALAKLKEAQAVPGEKSPYDNYVINALLGPIYVQKQDFADAAPALQAAAESQYANPEQQKAWLRAVASIYYQQKNWAKVVEVGEEALRHGANEIEMQTLIAQALFLDNKFKDAATAMQQVVAKQEKPEEKSLRFLWECYIRTGDEAAQGRVVEKLVMYYPKPDYWENAIASLLRAEKKDDHLTLELYRLMDETGILKRPADYSDMAELAIEQGYPGETQHVLEEALAKNVFTDQRDKDKMQRLMEAAKKQAAADQTQLSKSDTDAAAAATGDPSVQLGAAYLSYGMPDKAVASIGRGIAKGNLKHPEEGHLLLGIAQFRAGNKAEAAKSLDNVTGNNMYYVRLAHLWQLHVKG
jgi:hypothetical protein